VNRIASRKYVDGSRGQPCSFRMPGCDGGGETTVFAHIRDRHTGRSIKASDISGADACFHCHARFDGQLGAPLSEAEWLFYALRGLQETLENRVARGLLFLTQDVKREPKAKARKSRPSRPIPHNPDRKIQTRNNLRKAKV
jgi:hypothetical protein